MYLVDAAITVNDSDALRVTFLDNAVQLCSALHYLVVAHAARHIAPYDQPTRLHTSRRRDIHVMANPATIWLAPVIAADTPSPTYDSGDVICPRDRRLQNVLEHLLQGCSHITLRSGLLNRASRRHFNVPLVLTTLICSVV